MKKSFLSLALITFSVMQSPCFASEQQATDQINADPIQEVPVQQFKIYKVSPNDIRTAFTCILGIIGTHTGTKMMRKAFKAIHKNKPVTKKTLTLAQKCSQTIQRLFSNSVALSELALGSALTTIGGSLILLNDEVLSFLTMWGQQKVHKYANSISH